MKAMTGAAEIIHMFGYEGKEAKVSCSYDEGYESYEKYLCRNNCGSDDDVLITTTQGRKKRYSISDDKNKRVFTATISNLNQNDAGKYWCGVMRSGILKDYYPAERKDIFTLSFFTDVVFNPVVFIVPAALMFILIFVLVVIYKYKCHEVRGMFYIQYKCMHRNMNTYTQAMHIHVNVNKLYICTVLFSGTAARENRTTTRAADEEEADVRKPKSKPLLVDT
uniref:Immunoglobulin V-set domain-containing protein n=1 Tax=Anabas testudineus TaxID=64144 RepID=A0A3Q1J524_ANATE